MIQPKRSCDQCTDVIPDSKGFYRASLELLALNGVAPTGRTFIGHDFCSQGCFLTRVKAMLSLEGAGDNWEGGILSQTEMERLAAASRLADPLRS